MDTSLQIMKYANLADAGYGQGFAPIGWEIIKTASNSLSGFAATAFRNNDTGEIVVSYRGTDDLKDMTASDLSLALQKTPEQYRDARAFYTELTEQYHKYGSKYGSGVKC